MILLTIFLSILAVFGAVGVRKWMQAPDRAIVERFGQLATDEPATAAPQYTIPLASPWHAANVLPLSQGQAEVGA